MSTSVQLVVIGAGPGGYAAAYYAADLGLSVALVDPEQNPGGVCLYRGCIPSKALLHVAKLIGETRHASAFGITFSDPKIDLDALREFKNSVVQKLTSGVGQVGKLRKVKYIQGRASFEGPTSLKIDLVGPSTGSGQGGTEQLTFEHAIIATGSRPASVPGLSIDSPRVMDSTGALDLPDIPKTLLVVGGGYIGLELGSVYAALGTKVTVVEMTPGLLPGADRDLVGVLSRQMEKSLHRVLLNARVVEMKDNGKAVEVRIEGAPSTGSGQEGLSDADKKQTFDRVLVSVGRTPNSAVPGLDKTKVKVDQRGFIEVDLGRRTAEPTILAIGDVTGEPMLAHKASHEARTAVETAMGHKAAFEPQAIPAVVFTDPEVAWCGLTETEAQKQGRKVEVAKFSWGALSRAITLDRPDGLTKLIIDPGTERVLGVGIAGVGAGDLIAEGVLAVEMGALATDIKLSIHPHPTLSESVMEAAEIFFGQSTHVYKPRRKST